MSQQITQSLRLRKGFLVAGIVLLILSFFFFYWASRVDWDCMTWHDDVVHLDDPSYAQDYPNWGYSYQYYVTSVTMQPDDFLTEFSPESVQINETVHVVIWQTNPLTTTNEAILTYSDSGFLTFKNSKPYDYLSVDVYLVVQNIQNVTLSVTTTLNHYETPQWVYFGIGVFLSSLAVVSIVRSLSKPKPCSTEGSSQAERGNRESSGFSIQ